MKVKIRHYEEAKSVNFCDIDYKELDLLINFVKQSGGVYFNGNQEPFNSYQLVMDDGEAYIEILVGEEE